MNQMKYVKHYRHSALLMVLVLMAGCVTNEYPYSASVGINDRVVGVGYAVINAQPGNSPEEKRLMAIKVSKLEAYKSLAEQLYGQYLESRGSLRNLKMEEEALVSRVEGLIVGARVVSIKPISTDSYETILEIGRSEIAGLIDEPDRSLEGNLIAGGSE